MSAVNTGDVLSALDTQGTVGWKSLTDLNVLSSMFSPSIDDTGSDFSFNVQGCFYTKIGQITNVVVNCGAIYLPLTGTVTTFDFLVDIPTVVGPVSFSSEGYIGGVTGWVQNQTHVVGGVVNYDSNSYLTRVEVVGTASSSVSLVQNDVVQFAIFFSLQSN